MEKPRQYWAAAPPDELAGHCQEKQEKYWKYLESSGLLEKYRKSYNTYHGHTPSTFNGSTSNVSFEGEQGEFSTVKVNLYRNLINHLLVMITSSRPALEARATNDDYKSKAQTILANGLLDYYMRDKRLERYLKTACEQALYLSEGYVDLEWDVNAGEIYGVDPDTASPIKEGDVRYSNPFGPLEVIREVNANDFHASPWKIVIQHVNKYDLAAEYPEKADEILGYTPEHRDDYYRDLRPEEIAGDGDLVPIKKLYHSSTPALPGGRLFVYLDGNIWLQDGPMPYERLPFGIPLYRITPSDFHGTPFGYTHAWDILGLGDVHDTLYSVVTTNQSTFGVQNVLVPKGHDLSYQQLGGGLNVIEYDPQLGAPEALNLTQTPPEIFNFIEKLEKTEGLLLGVNDVIRGDPQASLKSGSALALIASQALQFNSGLQASYVALLEDVGTATIRLLQNFAETKRMASIAGKSERYMLQEFSGDDLSNVNRVIVDVTNPLSRTLSGRLEMAKDLLTIPGAIQTPDQYVKVISTGTLKPMTQGKQAEFLTIDLENEMLQDGRKPTAILTDDHALHVLEHKSVLSMPDSREKPEIIQAALAHIQEHIDLATNTDPRALMLTGQQPLMPPAPPPGQGNPAPGRDTPPSAPPSNPASAPEIEAKAASVENPQMPTNPLNGQPYDPSGGGPV